MLTRSHKSRVCGLVLLSQSVKTTNVRHTQTDGQTDRQTIDNGTLYAPRYEEAFCQNAKNDLGLASLPRPCLIMKRHFLPKGKKRAVVGNVFTTERFPPLLTAKRAVVGNVFTTKRFPPLLTAETLDTKLENTPTWRKYDYPFRNPTRPKPRGLHRYLSTSTLRIWVQFSPARPIVTSETCPRCGTF